MSGDPDDPDEAWREPSVKRDFSLAARIDWLRGDFETTAAKVRLLTAAATYFNVVALTNLGGRIAPARDPRLVEQGVAAAFQTFAGEDSHPTPFEKAAMLLRGIKQGHPFNDANKRTGFLTAAYDLDLMGLPIPQRMNRQVVIALCMRISSGEIRDVQVIADSLRRLWNA